MAKSMAIKVKPFEGVAVDGVYGASQFHFRTEKPFTDEQQEMIDYAIRLPTSGFVDAEFAANRRIIITTTIEPEYRERYSRLYQKAISSVIKGEWVNEIAYRIPNIKSVGLIWSELTHDEQYAIEAQYVDLYPYLDNAESFRWWKANPANHQTLKAIREVISEIEHYRRSHVRRTEAR